MEKHPGIIAATLLVLSLLSTPTWSMSTPSHSTLDEQRENYVKAKLALQKGRRREFSRSMKKLADYPLYPYLEYAELATRLNRIPKRDIDKFLAANKNTAIGGRLLSRWLNTLIKRDRWQDYLHYYQPSVGSTSRQCYYQLARYRSGEKDSAINAAIKLWTVGKSQPKGCDKLFGILIKYNHITEDIAWQRYSKAVLNHQYQLARYLKRFFVSSKYIAVAENFYNMDRNRKLVGRYELFVEHPAEVIEVIGHGIRHLARTDAPAALKHWSRYQQSHQFDPQSKSRIITELIKGLFDQDKIRVSDNYLIDSLDLVGTDLLEWRTRKALKQLDWPAVQAWIKRMPAELQQEHRWRYWLARSSHPEQAADTAQNPTYLDLTQIRNYYGFLSSEWLGNGYAMQHQPSIPNPQVLEALKSNPTILRARELLYHNEAISLRREWHYANKLLTESQWIAAAHLAQSWGWHNGAITSMIKASYWNDIDIRFPLAFKDAFYAHAEETNTPPHLLFALARQESALAQDVTSPAGAKGLMQLMPATAKQTARKNGISYRHSNDLFKPETNITLGSRYYKEMLDRFDNNRILATAAYNAGPHRVDRWLKETQGQLPFDVWVEIIPFRETRGYVQNVLAFSMIYAHHMGNHERILSEHEKNRML